MPSCGAGILITVPNSRCAEIAIAIGGNIGDRKAHLRQGVAALPPTVLVRRVSPLYESAPWGVTDQPTFLNAVLLAETALSPLALLDHLKAIERGMGREPGLRWGPRRWMPRSYA